MHPITENYSITNVVWPTNFEDPDQAAEDAFKGNFRELISKNALNVFNAAGDFLYSIEYEGFTSEIGKIKHADGDGFLYTATNDPYPQLRKYKVMISAESNIE